MNEERLVAGLDIGSARTTAIIAEVVGELPRHPTLKILGVGHARTTGLRKGVVINIEGTVNSVKKAIEEASLMAGCEVATDVDIAVARLNSDFLPHRFQFVATSRFVSSTTYRYLDPWTEGSGMKARNSRGVTAENLYRSEPRRKRER